MFNAHINPKQSNIQMSYIIKSKVDHERYVSKSNDGNYFLSTLTKVYPFDNEQEANKVANMLNNDSQEVEVLQIQNRTMW
ncbi:hypothetical protein [Petroclostridium sp. X23]|uniref:hypothetical protein n=1 Tax=Petroclostridium sp. X23 TaxID=3045146 RepID=UPI0024AD61A5|nr:hypothetical protein [Petroclostridium sp. X23]WHH59254.1 hypothetical protein QKW49_00350 [Petroclostridium sp. X23]